MQKKRDYVYWILSCADKRFICADYASSDLIGTEDENY